MALYALEKLSAVRSAEMRSHVNSFNAIHTRCFTRKAVSNCLPTGSPFLKTELTSIPGTVLDEGRSLAGTKVFNLVAVGPLVLVGEDYERLIFVPAPRLRLAAVIGPRRYSKWDRNQSPYL